MSNQSRILAAKTVIDVLKDHIPLNISIKKETSTLPDRDIAFSSEISYCTIRNIYFLKGILKKFLKRSLDEKNALAEAILLTGLAQICFMRTPAHAAINETVEALKNTGFSKLSGLGNAVLRNYIRNKDNTDQELQKSYETKYSYPEWIINKLKDAYGCTKLPDILNQGNLHPPFWIRLNTQKYTRENYLKLLNDIHVNATLPANIPTGIILEKGFPAAKLPLFKEGLIFIQDGAAQMAAKLLDPRPGDNILDACAAPGGKTTALLELCPDIHITALDDDNERIVNIHENLTRLKLQANVICGDASNDSWNKNGKYDRILLDAPCSALGVVRRHPDIKILRTPDEVAAIVELQKKILINLWGMLKSGGTFLYATCSILPEENTLQIKSFLQTHSDALYVPLGTEDSVDHPGWQRLPGDDGTDGFYYAKLIKSLSGNDSK